MNSNNIITNEMETVSQPNTESTSILNHDPHSNAVIENNNEENSNNEPIIEINTTNAPIAQKHHISYDDYNDDDTFHVEIDESQWLSCIPKISLTVATIIAAILGVFIGLSISLTNTELSEGWKNIIGFPGKLWIRALTLLVLPLICLMMVVLPSRVLEIGFVGKYCIPLYLFTSLCAAIQGTAWGWLIRPGSHGKILTSITTTNSMTTDPPNLSELDSFLFAVENAVPNNIIIAFYEMNILGVITFFLTIGILLRTVKEEHRLTVLNFSKAILKCCMLAVVWLIWLTPFGMCSLVTVKVAGTEDLSSLIKGLGFYIMTILIGEFVHVFAFYPLLFWITTRLNGYKFLSSIYEVSLLAFATSSSAATLPRSLQVAEKIGIRSNIYHFVLPLGSCINMDGTALGFPIMIAFISQLYGVHQSFGTIVLIAVLSVTISVGAAPIPNAGMIYLLMLFRSAHLSQYRFEAIATLFVLDWFVDRIATAVNVTSDQFVAKIVDVWDLRQSKKDDSDDGSVVESTAYV